MTLQEIVVAKQVAYNNAATALAMAFGELNQAKRDLADDGKPLLPDEAETLVL